MATPEFGTGKTVLVLVIVAGCFAILWPRVFEPMMQAAFTMTKPRIEAGEQACCQVIYENDIDVRFFAELCNTVVHREARTDSAIRSHRKDSASMPAGMLKQCHVQLEQLCGTDTALILLEVVGGEHGAPYSFRAPIAGRPFNASLLEERLKRLTDCLEEHFTNLPKRLPRRVQKPQVLPLHVHQERSSKLHPEITHPALREKGHPFPALAPQQQTNKQTKPGWTGAGLRPAMANAGKTKPASTKASGPMGLVMPVYTIGIVLFFVYTIIKVAFRKPEDKSRKVMDFHMDPEHRKFVLSEEYENGTPRSLKKETPRVKVKKLEAEVVSRAADILGGDGRQIVFTAIEGIIAEMDEFSDKIAADRTVKFASDALQEEVEEESADENVVDAEVIKHEEVEESQTLRRRCVPQPPEEVEVADAGIDAEQDEDSLLERMFPVGKLAEDARIAVLGMETQATFEGASKPKPPAEEIEGDSLVASADGRSILQESARDGPMSNIVLETSVAAGTHLLVAESESTSRRAEIPEGWQGECDDQPIVVTGKMTISLLADRNVSIEKAVISPPIQENNQDIGSDERALPGHAHLEVSNAARKHVEELASTLLQDIFQNELPKALEECSKGTAAVSQADFDSPRANADRRDKMTAWRQSSKDSVGSLTASFEYMTANVDEMPKDTDREKSPTDSDAGNDVSGYDYLPESDPRKQTSDELHRTQIDKAQDGGDDTVQSLPELQQVNTGELQEQLESTNCPTVECIQPLQNDV